ELAGGVSEVLEELGDGWIFCAQSDFRPRETDLGQASTNWRLAGDECRTAGRATLLTVEIRKHRPFFGDPIDIRGLVPHDPVVVTTHIEPTNVVGHDEQNVRLGALRHEAPFRVVASRSPHRWSGSLTLRYFVERPSSHARAGRLVERQTISGLSFVARD